MFRNLFTKRLGSSFLSLVFKRSGFICGMILKFFSFYFLLLLFFNFVYFCYSFEKWCFGSLKLKVLITDFQTKFFFCPASSSYYTLHSLKFKLLLYSESQTWYICDECALAGHSWVLTPESRHPRNFQCHESHRFRPDQGLNLIGWRPTRTERFLYSHWILFNQGFGLYY